MNNFNIGVLVSSVLATAGLGIYVYMNNNNNIITEYLNDENDEDVNNEETEHFYENDKNTKITKKLLSVKSKRRNSKQTGTRRKRY